MIATAEPVYTRRGFRFMALAFGYDRLLLPFTRDGTNTDLALLVLLPVDARVKTAADWRSMREVPPEWIRAE
jgi:hypothetical protein